MPSSVPQVSLLCNITHLSANCKKFKPPWPQFLECTVPAVTRSLMTAALLSAFTLWQYILLCNFFAFFQEPFVPI